MSGVFRDLKHVFNMFTFKIIFNYIAIVVVFILYPPYAGEIYLIECNQGQLLFLDNPI